MEAFFDVEAMRECVKASGLKQRFIAEQIGVAEKTLSYILTGRTRCSVGVYAKICTLLNKPLDEFIRRGNEETENRPA